MLPRREVYIPRQQADPWALCEEVRDCEHTRVAGAYSLRPGILVTDLLSGEGPYPHNDGFNP